MKLWGGRFTKETNQLVFNFNASISFDQKFYKQDIQGSLAHVKMLAKQGIISNEDKDKIVSGLTGILNDIESGKLEISQSSEDIHTFVEQTLIERIGDAGKRLHTGRSRNDQVALDMRLYTRDEVVAIKDLLKELMKTGAAVCRKSRLQGKIRSYKHNLPHIVDTFQKIRIVFGTKSRVCLAAVGTDPVRIKIDQRRGVLQD
jgi:argininosuccinate lyase